VLSHPQPTPGVYQFKVDVGTFSASPYGGDTAMEGMEDVSAGSLYELEAALYKACAEKSGIATYNYQCDLVKPGVALFTACIGTAAAASAAASLGIMPSDALGQTHSGVPPPGVALGMMPMYTPPQMATARVPQSLLPMASKPMLAQPHGAPGSNGSGAYPPPSAEPPSLMGRARVSVAATAISGTQVSQRVPATSAWVTEPAGTQKAPVTAPLVLSV